MIGALIVNGVVHADAAVNSELFSPFKAYEAGQTQAMKLYGSETEAKRTVLFTEWTQSLGTENKPPRFILERRARKKARQAAERWARHHSISKANVFQKKTKDKAKRQAEKLNTECQRIETALAVYGKYELLHTMYLTHKVEHLTQTVAALETRLAAVEQAAPAAAPALAAEEPAAPVVEEAPAETPAVEPAPAATPVEEPVTEPAPPVVSAEEPPIEEPTVPVEDVPEIAGPAPADMPPAVAA